MAEQGNNPETPAKTTPVPAAAPAANAASPSDAASAPGAASVQGAVPAPGAASAPETAPQTSKAEKTPLSAEAVSLLGLIDKLTELLEKSDLVELDVEAGQSGIVLRKPAALWQGTPASMIVAPVAAADAATAAAPTEPAVAASTARAVRAPLTGIFYSSSSPSTPAYVTVGQEIVVGQVIGLIEAMKLFNEIKSDVAGKVVRMVAETGKLVKAKQPLIEVAL